MSMQIQPLNNQVLVRRDPEDTVSDGGIVIPDAAHNPQMPRGRGVVIAAGPGKKHPKTGMRLEPSVKKGDRVVFSKLSGDKVRDDLCVDADKDLVLISEDEILCVLED